MTPSPYCRAAHWPLLLLIALAWASAAVAASPPDELLDELHVSGEQPGPAMWRVSRGEHTLWIMGTLSPVPSRMQWHSSQAAAVIDSAGEILAPSTDNVHFGGFFTTLRYLPALLRLRHNADGATLREVLPPELYARWQAAHRRWFGHEPDPKEKSRPLYAAELLWQQAMEKSGLERRDPVWPVVRDLAGHRDVHIREREFVVQLQEPRALIADLAALPRDKEAACLAAMLDRIERELPDMRRRAAAWAVGDVATLRALPRKAPMQSCLEAVLDKPRLREVVEAQRARMAGDWSGIVDWLLLTQATSFTVLPVDELLDADGVLARLRAKGYVVAEPR